MRSNMKSKVSILMTCFNAEAFIEKSINSIKNQSFKRWELTIVDDFSKVLPNYQKFVLFQLRYQFGF